MRELRPEFYSDTSDRTAYQLDASALEYHLDSITSRNQTHDFRDILSQVVRTHDLPKLEACYRSGGRRDSKADSETIPIADEIATLTYVGTQMLHRSVGHSLSVLKRKWAEKVRNDVAGIVATQRGYQKVYCVTAQFAPGEGSRPRRG